MHAFFCVLSTTIVAKNEYFFNAASYVKLSFADRNSLAIYIFFLTGVTFVLAAPIEGALPIPIWRILKTPGYAPLNMTCHLEK